MNHVQQTVFVIPVELLRLIKRGILRNHSLLQYVQGRESLDKIDVCSSRMSWILESKSYLLSGSDHSGTSIEIPRLDFM